MPDLPARANFDHLRGQAKDLLRAARRDDPDAIARIQAISGQLNLASAQAAIACEYGFSNWSALKAEVERLQAER
jgi:uncharacterized protein